MPQSNNSSYVIFKFFHRFVLFGNRCYVFKTHLSMMQDFIAHKKFIFIYICSICVSNAQYKPLKKNNCDVLGW